MKIHIYAKLRVDSELGRKLSVITAQPFVMWFDSVQMCLPLLPCTGTWGGELGVCVQYICDSAACRSRSWRAVVSPTVFLSLQSEEEEWRLRGVGK